MWVLHVSTGERGPSVHSGVGGQEVLGLGGPLWEFLLSAALGLGSSSSSRWGDVGRGCVSAIAVGAAGVHGGYVSRPGRPQQLPKAVTQVLHLAGAQHTAHPQEPGSGAVGARGAAVAAGSGAAPGTVTAAGGQAGTPLRMDLPAFPDCRARCRPLGVRVTESSLGPGSAGGHGGSET